MKKSVLTVIAILLLLPLATHAQQAKVNEEMIKKGSEKVPGYIATYRHSRSVTKEAMKEMVKEMGIKKNHTKKGFHILKGAVWQGISTTKGDYYYKIGGKKKKAKLYFAASKGYDNYVTTANDPGTAANIKAFLQGLDNKLEIAEQIKDKEQELKKLDKRTQKDAGKLKDSESEKAKMTQELEALKKSK